MTYKIFKHKSTKRGDTLVFILQPGGKKVQTGYTCSHSSWDQDKQIVKLTGTNRDPKAAQINGKLKRACVALDEILEQTNDVGLIRIKYQAYLNSIGSKPDESPKTPMLRRGKEVKLTPAGQKFYNTVQRVIVNHQSDWSKAHRSKVNVLASKILAYEPNFSVEMITADWFREYVTWCVTDKEGGGRGNISNTISTDVGAMESLCKALSIEFKFDWSYVQPEVTGLDWDKVLKIRDLDLTNHPSHTIRDSRVLWLASAFTGRRWSEIVNVIPENFYLKDGNWRYKNIQKGQRMVDIPLLPEAIQLLEPRGFSLPKLNNYTVNLDIKEIAKLAGITDPVLVIKPIDAERSKQEVVPEYKTVHFHTARHSYCYRIVDLFDGEKNADKLISRLMGHASPLTTWMYRNRSKDSDEQTFQKVIGGAN